MTRLIDTLRQCEFSTGMDYHKYVIEAPDDHPFFVGFDKGTHYLRWVMGELPVLISYTADEISARNAAEEQAKINIEAREYLTLTDWYVIRQQETGIAIPAEILAERQSARLRIK